eukprot:gene9909-7776_t
MFKNFLCSKGIGKCASFDLGQAVGPGTRMGTLRNRRLALVRMRQFHRASALRTASVTSVPSRTRIVSRRCMGRDDDPIARAVQEGVVAAQRSGRVGEFLENAMRTNEALRQQVISEGQRASDASRELATIITRMKDGDKRRAQGIGKCASFDLGQAVGPGTRMGTLRNRRLALVRMRQFHRASALRTASVTSVPSRTRIVSRRCMGRDDDPIARAVQEGVVAAQRSGRVGEFLENAMRTNEALRQQVISEGQRASDASRELATIITRMKDGDKRRAQGIGKCASFDLGQAVGPGTRMGTLRNRRLALVRMRQFHRASALRTASVTSVPSRTRIVSRRCMGRDDDPIARAVQEGVVAAQRSGRVGEFLENAMRTNEALRQQVISEGQRASDASRELATIITRMKDGDKRRAQGIGKCASFDLGQAVGPGTRMGTSELKRKAGHTD